MGKCIGAIYCEMEVIKMLFSCEKKKTNIRNVLIRVAGSLMLWLVLGLTLGIAVKAETVKGTATVTANSLNIRSGPGKEFDAIGKVSAGDVLDASEIDGEWIKITYNNKEGYVALEYVEFEPDEEVIEETQEEELAADVPDVEADEKAETEDESSLADYKLVFILLGIIVVVMIIILLTIKSIKDMDRDDEDEYDDDEYEDDEYEEDEYEEDEYDEDEYEDDEYEEDDEVDYDEEDEVDYEDDDEYEYEHIIVRRPKQSTNKKKSNSDDYSINIDPRYFD